MSLAAVRTALAGQINSATRLRTYDKAPDNPTVPCGFTGPVAGRYQDDFDGDLTFTVPFYVLLSAGGGNARALDAADGYVEKSGASSIYAAVQGDNTLGGACQSAVVVDFDEALPPFDFLEADYFGVTFTVEIMA